MYNSHTKSCRHLSSIAYNLVMEAVVCIQDVYNIKGTGLVPVGHVRLGMLRVGMKLNINGRIMTVKWIEMHHKKFQEAKAGDNIGFLLDNADGSLLSQFKNKNVTFSDDGKAIMQAVQRADANRPKGASFL